MRFLASGILFLSSFFTWTQSLDKLEIKGSMLEALQILAADYQIKMSYNPDIIPDVDVVISFPTKPEPESLVKELINQGGLRMLKIDNTFVILENKKKTGPVKPIITLKENKEEFRSKPVMIMKETITVYDTIVVVDTVIVDKIQYDTILSYDTLKILDSVHLEIIDTIKLKPSYIPIQLGFNTYYHFWKEAVTNERDSKAYHALKVELNIDWTKKIRKFDLYSGVGISRLSGNYQYSINEVTSTYEYDTVGSYYIINEQNDQVWTHIIDSTLTEQNIVQDFSRRNQLSFVHVNLGVGWLKSFGKMITHHRLSAKLQIPISIDWISFNNESEANLSSGIIPTFEYVFGLRVAQLGTHDLMLGISVSHTDWNLQMGENAQFSSWNFGFSIYLTPGIRRSQIELQKD